MAERILTLCDTCAEEMKNGGFRVKQINMQDFIAVFQHILTVILIEAPLWVSNYVTSAG